MNSGKCRYVLYVDSKKEGDTAALCETFDIVDYESPWNELKIRPITWKGVVVGHVLLDDRMCDIHRCRTLSKVEETLRNLIETGSLTEKGLNIKG